MAGLSRAFTAAAVKVLSLIANGMNQTKAFNRSASDRAWRGPGKRTILNMRPSHPGKPRSYYQRDTVPKRLREAA